MWTTQLCGGDTPTVPLTGDDLTPLIDEFTEPERFPDGRHAAPLWDQLHAVKHRGVGADGRSVHRSRPPISTEVVSLIQEVRSACERRMRDAGREPIIRTRVLSDAERDLIRPSAPRPGLMLTTVLEVWRDVAAELRAINTITAGDAEQTVWADRVAEWVHRARSVLGLLPPRVQLPRGTRCMDCGQAWVVAEVDGERVRRPAVKLVWHRNGTLHYVACSACGGSRWPHDLPALAAAQV